MAYIIILQEDEEVQIQIFAADEFKMMSVLKKAISTEKLIVSVTAVENIVVANDYLDETDPDLNFGSEKE